MPFYYHTRVDATASQCRPGCSALGFAPCRFGGTHVQRGGRLEIHRCRQREGSPASSGESGTPARGDSRDKTGGRREPRVGQDLPTIVADTGDARGWPRGHARRWRTAHRVGHPTRRDRRAVGPALGRATVICRDRQVDAAAEWYQGKQSRPAAAPTTAARERRLANCPSAATCGRRSGGTHARSVVHSREASGCGEPDTAASVAARARPARFDCGAHSAPAPGARPAASGTWPGPTSSSEIVPGDPASRARPAPFGLGAHSAPAPGARPAGPDVPTARRSAGGFQASGVARATRGASFDVVCPRPRCCG
jgi:hypothetical protein